MQERVEDRVTRMLATAEGANNRVYAEHKAGFTQEKKALLQQAQDAFDATVGRELPMVVQNTLKCNDYMCALLIVSF
jgi:hypothetical protein